MARILVTGGAGFIGSHLVNALLSRGDDVIVLDDLSTGRESNLAPHLGTGRVELIRGSVLDEALVAASMRRCDAVLHLAAAVGVSLIVERPLEGLATNIRGSEIVLAQAHAHGRKTLVASTSEIYGKNTAASLVEDDDRVLGSPLRSRWSYSEAKAIEELLAFTYWKDHGLPTVIVRLFNTVGPRQVGTYGMVVPRLVGQALAGKPLTVFGDGQQRRCFCHVADAVGGILAVFDDPRAEGDVFNIGSSNEVTILELAERVKDMTDSSSEIELIPYAQAYPLGFEDMQRRRPSTEKIEALTGWKAKRSIDEIILDVASSMRTSAH